MEGKYKGTMRQLPFAASVDTSPRERSQQHRFGRVTFPYYLNLFKFKFNMLHKIPYHKLRFHHTITRYNGFCY